MIDNLMENRIIKIGDFIIKKKGWINGLFNQIFEERNIYINVWIKELFWWRFGLGGLFRYWIIELFRQMIM